MVVEFYWFCEYKSNTLLLFVLYIEVNDFIKDSFCEL